MHTCRVKMVVAYIGDRVRLETQNENQHYELIMHQYGSLIEGGTGGFSGAESASSNKRV
jgi:hypothetical protein